MVTYGRDLKVAPVVTSGDRHLTRNMNDFDLLEQIGQGAFGRVFKAKRKSTNEMFAAKVCGLAITGFRRGHFSEIGHLFKRGHLSKRSHICKKGHISNVAI